MTIAESLPPPGTPPIDSARKALIVASRDYFKLHSCESEKWQAIAREYDKYWTVRWIDVDPVCGAMIVAVCKESGKLANDSTGESCDD